MDQIRAVQKIVFKDFETIVEKTNFTLEIENSKSEAITSAKIQLFFINAEWWVTIGERYKDSYYHYYPIEFHVLRKPDQIVELNNCKFCFDLNINGSLQQQSQWFEMSNHTNSWDSGRRDYPVDARKNDIVIDVAFTIKRCDSTSVKSKFYNQIDGYNEIIANYSKMFKDPTFSDFTYVVKGKKFKVHKAVLAAVSPFFMRLFTSGMQESRESSGENDKIEPDTFESVLKFIYEAKLPEKFQEVAQDLYEAAHYYDMERLKKICEKEILSQLCLDNAIELYTWAFAYDFEELKTDAWNIIKRDKLKIYFRLKNEPLSPEALHKIIVHQEMEKLYWESVKESPEQTENIK